MEVDHRKESAGSCGNQCDVPGFHSIDPRLISSIDPGPRQGSHRAALRDHRHRKQYTDTGTLERFFHHETQVNYSLPNSPSASDPQLFSYFLVRILVSYLGLR